MAARMPPNRLLATALGVVLIGAMATEVPSCTKILERYGIVETAAPMLPTSVTNEAPKEDFCPICLARATPQPAK